MTRPAADAYDAVFDALAHPARRRILTSLNFAEGQMTAGAIAALFAHAWPTTTRHLQTLERAGLLTQTRAGRSRCYRLNRVRLALAAGWLGWFHRDPVTGLEIPRHELDARADAAEVPQACSASTSRSATLRPLTASTPRSWAMTAARRWAAGSISRRAASLCRWSRSPRRTSRPRRSTS